MAITYTGTTIGRVTIKQGENTYKLQIRRGNALAILIHSRKITEEEKEQHPNAKYFHTIYAIFADKEHLRNILKNEGRLFWDEVKKIELNLFYPECKTLAEYFTKAGHRVTCYYKQGKQ